MVRVHAIPQELWQRLAALDDRFDFTLKRTDVPGTSPEGRYTGGRNYRRMWRVEVTPRGGGAAMTTEGPDLASVLSAAVGAAEQKAAAFDLPIPAPLR